MTPNDGQHHVQHSHTTSIDTTCVPESNKSMTEPISSFQARENVGLKASGIYGGTNCLTQDEAAKSAIEAAFLVPSDIFQYFWELHRQSANQESHTVILTIPAQRRVASVVLSVPRAEATQLSSRFKLPTIFTSSSS